MTILTSGSAIRPVGHRVVASRLPDWPLGRDEVYALAAVAILLGNVVGGKAVLFSCIGFLIIIIDHRMIMARAARLLTPRFIPLILFIIVHLLSGLTVSGDVLLHLIVQILSVAAFAVPFFLRYSVQPMARFNRAFGILVILIVALIVAWHTSQGAMTGWKLLGETKGAFSLLPVVVLAYVTARKRLNLWGVCAIALSALVILFSGERKAYQIMAIALLLMANLRNPLVYLAAAAGLVALPMIAAVDPTGYVQRQLDSVLAFGQGEVAQTLSNRMREWQFEYAISLFQQNPLFGVGTRNYVPTMTGVYQSSTSDVIVPGLTIHGDALRVLVENGLIGSVFWTFMLVSYALMSISRFRSGQRRSAREIKISFLVVFSFYTLIAFEAYDTTMMIAYMILPALGLLNVAPLLPERSFASGQSGKIRSPAVPHASR